MTLIQYATAMADAYRRETGSFVHCGPFDGGVVITIGNRRSGVLRTEDEILDALPLPSDA